MSALIRSTRLSGEPRSLSSGFAAGSPRIVDLPVHTASTHSPAIAGAVIRDYAEFEARFANELRELEQQTLGAAREEGLREAREQAHAECAPLLATLRSLISSARSAQQRSIESLADDAAEIVFTAVTKILGRSVFSPDAAVAAVREAIQQCKERSLLQVRVAPEQLSLLESRRGEWLEGAAAGEVTLLADRQISAGGCIVESPFGSLDARFEEQLQRLRETLVTERERWSAPE